MCGHADGVTHCPSEAAQGPDCGDDCQREKGGVAHRLSEGAHGPHGPHGPHVQAAIPPHLMLGGPEGDRRVHPPCRTRRHAHPSAPEVGFLSADTGRRIPPRVFVSSSATRTSTRSPFGCSCRISEGLEDKGDGAVGASVTCAATQYRRHRGQLGTLV